MDRLETVIPESLIKLVLNIVSQAETENKQDINDIYEAFDELPLYFAQMSSSNK